MKDDNYLNGLPSKTNPCTDWIQRTASSSFEYVIYLGNRKKSISKIKMDKQNTERRETIIMDNYDIGNM